MSPTSAPRAPRLSRYAWAVLLANLVVILWGAYVRASGSGAGCGSHWPLCNGEVLPRAPALATLVELTHRVTSGIAFLLVAVLVVLVWRTRPRGHAARAASAAAMAFMVLEAAIGAGLVLFQKVAHDASIGRIYWFASHLINTFLLLAALTLTAWWLRGDGATNLRAHPPRGGPAARWLVATSVLGVLLVGVSGAIAALGDTLFPVSSLAEGIRRDFAPTAHLFVRLRVLHPFLAVAVGAYLVVASVVTALRTRDIELAGLARLLGALVLGQLVIGVVNVTLLAPIPLQLLHLLAADAVWIALVLFSATLLAPAPAASPATAPLRSPPLAPTRP